MSLDLQHALERLYGLERRKDKLGLEGTRALMAALGHPECRFRSVHVAGTNGKGSTCALIERVLRESGARTGLFTSPHLVDFRERIRVRGQWADDVRLGERLEFMQALPEGRDRTFFEVCTALAFDDFAARGVEWAVVEVGLGGRLDCTNVITPEVCAITSIGLDHTEILGDTLEAIAAEKAGIVKRGVPVVVAGPEPAALAVIERIAAENGAPMIHPPRAIRAGSLANARRGTRDDAPANAGRVMVETESWGRLEIEIALTGAHQIANLETAIAVLDQLARRGLAISDEAVRAGLERTRWPGRLEACPDQPRLWWDGAHNAAGIAALMRAWDERWPGERPRAIVLALSRDKDAAEIVRTLTAPAVGRPTPTGDRPTPPAPATRLIAARTRSERALDPAELERLARAAGFAAERAGDVPAACRAALERTGPEDRVLLTGSLFAVGEAMEAFGGAPGEWQ